MTAKLFSAQNDFSFGQVNASARRRDDADVVRRGGRVVANWRITSTGQLMQRPGRRALFAPGGLRVERVRMGDGAIWEIAFGAGAVSIFTTDGVLAAQNVSTDYLWSATTTGKIVFCVAVNDIVICFPGMKPQIVRWTPKPAAWSFLPFSFNVSANQTHQPFYRFSALGATMRPSDVTGQIVMTCSAPYFTAAMVGHTLSYVGQQVTIIQVLSTQRAICQVAYRLPQTVSIPVNECSIFQQGQEAQTAGENIKIEIWSTTATSGPGFVLGTLLSTISFMSAWNGMNGAVWDSITSPLGTATLTGAPLLAATPAGSLQWQEEFMSDLQGWPSSCFYDRGRLGFCGFAQMTGAVLWGAIDGPNDFWIDTVAAAMQPTAGVSADAAIFDIVPGSPVVKFVVAIQGDQFVFTDRGVYYVPIQAGSNPLKPGSVEFRQISNDGCASIQPVTTQDTIAYINAGQTRCAVIRATGAQTRPYSSEDISDPNSDLFKTPVALAITTGDGQFSERYVYVLNANGSLVVGKFSSDRKIVGWAPWTGAYPTTWVATDGSVVLYTTAYPGGAICEQEDASLYLDGAVPVAAPPAALAVAGKGPAWHAAGATGVLMAKGSVDLGDRAIDAAGNIGFVSGDDPQDATLIVGVAYPPSTFQPFPRNAPTDGAAVSQRQRRRKVTQAVAHVINATGFVFGSRVIAATQFGEDALAAPVLRETAYTVRILGRDYDPPLPQVVLNRPGPFTLCEYGQEETV